MMAKLFDKGARIVYPAGCKDLSEDLSKDELVRRLKLLARAFQDMGQDENNEYKELAVYLASEFFMDHQNKDVKLLVACCIADIFRIFAPEAPYTEPALLKDIFMFLTQQLRGLEDPEAPMFKRYFYLLENLAWVKSFNICIELDDNQEVFCSLYKLIFNIVNDRHSNKVLNFLLDMMCPLITEADAVSQELLDIILVNVINPIKSQNKVAYTLAKDLIRRTANAMEPYVQTFFNNALMLGKNSESEVSGKLFDLIYELNSIAPSVLLAVLPQLEFKLKSSDESERKGVTKLLAKMFSDPDSNLAMQNKPLWMCFLGRFNDIDLDVRRICVQATTEFIVNHPDLVKDIAEHLTQKQHDPDENVRMDVVQAIISAGKREFNNVNQELLTCVKERTLDKKYKIRKEALMGLGWVYKKVAQMSDADDSDKEKVAWIRNKVLHAYYQTSIDDRILVERVLNSSLVPYSLEPKEKMKQLLILYSNLDEHAVKAFQEIFRGQVTLRNLVRNLLDLHQKAAESNDVNPLIMQRVMQITKYLPDPQKSSEYIKKFNRIVKEDQRIRNCMIKLVSTDCPCKRAEELVKEVLKKMGNPIPLNFLYSNVKVLLERIAPLMIDSTAIKALINMLDESITGVGDMGDEIDNASEKGMRLLLMLSGAYPGSFLSEDVFGHLITLVKLDDDIISDYAMQIFTTVGINLETQFPNIYSGLLPVLQKMVKIGTPKQAKHAIHCINKLCKNKESIFKSVFEHLSKNMELDSVNFLTSLVAIGHMAQLCPGEFSTPVKSMVSKFIVKELLMQDRDEAKHTTESWYADHLVSEETQAKVQALKMMTRWLLGLKSNTSNAGVSTLRLLHTLLLHEGDLMERGLINKAEKARLRLEAGCCMLKLAQESCYESLITLDQFQAVALLLNDPCYQVRVRFAQKLHKGLVSLKLPLQYMAVFSLAANDPIKERQKCIKQFLITNISRRRDYLKQNTKSNVKVYSVLPDYVLPFTIHLLAHDPDLTNNDDLEALRNIRECLWFILEPLITKNENYSYSFYKKLIENIKQTKDVQEPENEEINKKLYAVCDLALGLVMTKTANFILKDFPAEPVLPAKLFTNPDQNYSNTKCYLPEELMMTAAKRKHAGLSTPQAATTVSRVSDKKTNNKSPPGSPTSDSSPPQQNKKQKTSKDNDTEVAKKRGRQQKTNAKDSENESDDNTEQLPAKKRGRPVRKSQDSINGSDIEPHSPAPQAQSKRGRPAAKKAAKTDSESEDSNAAPVQNKRGRKANKPQSADDDTSENTSQPKSRGRPIRKQQRGDSQSELSDENSESPAPVTSRKAGRSSKQVEKTTLNKQKQKGRDGSPLKTHSTNTTAQSKAQGKITDFISRSKTTAKPSKQQQQKAAPKSDTSQSTPTKNVASPMETRRRVVAMSPSTRSGKLRKRAPSSENGSIDSGPTSKRLKNKSRRKYKPSPHQSLLMDHQFLLGQNLQESDSSAYIEPTLSSADDSPFQAGQRVKVSQDSVIECSSDGSQNTRSRNRRKSGLTRRTSPRVGRIVSYNSSFDSATPDSIAASPCHWRDSPRPQVSGTRALLRAIQRY